MSSFISALKSFTLHPQQNYLNAHPSIKTKASETIKATALYIGLAIIAFIPVFCLIKLVDHFFALDILKIRNDHMKKIVNGSHALLVVTLIGPFVEETMFRLWLSFKKAHVAISLLVITFAIILKTNGINLYSAHITKNYVLYFTEAIILASALFAIIKITHFRRFAERHFKAVYYCSCIGFGLIHMVNFAPFKLSILWAYPLFTLPQIILGFISGYIRIKNGFVWGLILHCIINLGLSLMQLNN